MCPNSQILSAFIDGELPDKFEKQVAKHLQSCEECSKKIESLNQMRETLKSANAVRNELVLRSERSWAVIQRSLLSRKKTPLIFRDIRLPIPLAAILLILCIGASIGITYTSMRPPVYEDNIAEIPTFDSMEELIVFLDSNQKIQTMEINLPEEPFFLFISKPTLIPEAEYKAVKW